MKCMCAQTRPRFILSSEGVLGGMEFEPMLTPREKSPLPKMSPEEDRTRDAVDSEPKHYQLSYSGPHPHLHLLLPFLPLILLIPVLLPPLLLLLLLFLLLILLVFLLVLLFFPPLPLLLLLLPFLLLVFFLFFFSFA